jgi:hypothetical protein
MLVCEIEKRLFLSPPVMGGKSRLVSKRLGENLLMFLKKSE